MYNVPVPRFPSHWVYPRWWGFAERLDRAGQIGQGFPDGNQLAALTLHGFILPCPPDKTGAPST